MVKKWRIDLYTESFISTQKVIFPGNKNLEKIKLCQCKIKYAFYQIEKKAELEDCVVSVFQIERLSLLGLEIRKLKFLLINLVQDDTLEAFSGDRTYISELTFQKTC